MSEVIEESGMKFGPFPADQLLHIEKCPQYTSIRQSIKITEFIYYDVNKVQLLSLEAKTSAPNPRSEKVENPAKIFHNFILEIKEKFENSLDLYLSLALKEELPEGFNNIDYKNIHIVFALVIRNHKREWLNSVEEALNQEISPAIKGIWRIRIIVMNEEKARNQQLIEKQ